MPLLSELHFFELDLGEGAAELRPAIVSMVHGFNLRNENALGVDFLNTIARVFGDATSLTAFFEQPRVKRLAALSETTKGPAPVPATTAGVALTRHRGATRQQPARLRRFARRNPGVALIPARVIRSDLAIPMSSQSTRQDFLLKLARREAPLTDAVTFNGYGLCTDGTCLPKF